MSVVCVRRAVVPVVSTKKGGGVSQPAQMTAGELEAEISRLQGQVDAAWGRQDREEAFELMAILLHLDDERERRRS